MHGVFLSGLARVAHSLFLALLGFDAEGRSGLGEKFFVIEVGFRHGGDRLEFYLL
ncbi:hypothetical protein FQZ97_667500 [compost metagenome]